MTSPENQEKICKADEVSRKKEEKAAEKQGLVKKLTAEDKKNNLPFCHNVYFHHLFYALCPLQHNTQWPIIQNFLFGVSL